MNDKKTSLREKKHYNKEKSEDADWISIFENWTFRSRICGSIAKSKDSDLTGQMRNLSWAFAFRMCNKALFAMEWFILTSKFISLPLC